MPTKHSYGIACCRWNRRTRRLEMLLIKKKVSFAFVEFLFGHYIHNNNANEKRLTALLNGMTIEEKIDVLSFDYGKLWYRAWTVDPDSEHAHPLRRLTGEKLAEYQKLKELFTRHLLHDGGRKLRHLVDHSSNQKDLWEVPKGHKMGNEKDINCALREFYEETGLAYRLYTLADYNPISLDVHDKNMCYRSHYFPAYTYSDQVKVRYIGGSQIEEITDIAWMGRDQIATLHNGSLILKLFHDVQRRVGHLINKDE